jgi:hypothetical protein
VLFAQPSKGLDRSAAQQPEVPGVLRDANVADPLNQPIESKGGQFF